MAKFVVAGKKSDDVFLALHRLGVFADDPKMVRRVVIDLEHGSAAKIYVERFADDRLVGVLMHGGLELVDRSEDE